MIIPNRNCIFYYINPYPILPYPILSYPIVSYPICSCVYDGCWRNGAFDGRGLLLYPDGTSTTAQVILADVYGRRWAIQLRGVTGRSTNLRLTAVDASSLPSIVSTVGATP